MNLLSRLHKSAPAALPGSLTAAADQLQTAIDVYAAEYGQHQPGEVDETAARAVFADLARITRDIELLRRSGSVVGS